uniref:Uncharacterized protein n=1 Tax=Acrobeloides nanus TaxID=290746 RepID=A0A914C909_9BILA
MLTLIKALSYEALVIVLLFGVPVLLQRVEAPLLNGVAWQLVPDGFHRVHEAVLNNVELHQGYIQFQAITETFESFASHNRERLTESTTLSGRYRRPLTCPQMYPALRSITI